MWASLADNVARIGGFMDELQTSGIDTSKMWVAESDFSPAGGWAAAKELVASGHPRTALFCANDELAVGALDWKAFHFHFRPTPHTEPRP